MAQKRLNHLCALTKGWDGHRAPPVSFSAAHFALDILGRLGSAVTETPQIVPGTAGNLQMEWCIGNIDIEVEVKGPFKVSATYYNCETDDEDFMELTNDFGPLAKWFTAAHDLQEATKRTTFA